MFMQSLFVMASILGGKAIGKMFDWNGIPGFENVFNSEGSPNSEVMAPFTDLPKLGGKTISNIFDWNGIPGFENIFYSEGNPDTGEMIDSQLLEKIRQSAVDNLYLLYTRQNAIVPQTLYFNNVTSIKVSNFNPNVPVVVLAHGWTGNRNANLNPVLRDAFLIKSDVNVIILDWCRLALSNYVTAAAGVPLIGQGLGMFLDFLRSTTRIPYDQMHLVGFSLGAHVVGSAGRQLKGRVARITALDPAGPLWHLSPDCVSNKDAVYVEVVHTNAGFASLGIGWNVGHVDFYPNGGGSQPGCSGQQLCSHQRAWEIYAAAIVYQHLIGKECTSPLQMSMNSCNGKPFQLGNLDLKTSGSGTYRFNTDMYYPYKILE